MHVIVPVPFKSFENEASFVVEEVLIDFEWMMRWILYHWPLFHHYGGVAPDLDLLDAVSEQINCTFMSEMERNRATEQLEKNAEKIVKWSEEIYGLLRPTLRCLPSTQREGYILEDFAVAPFGDDATLVTISHSQEVR